LLGFVEINHYVAAEDDVVPLRQEFRFQIMEVEMNELLDRFLDRLAFVDLVEIAEPGGVLHRFHMML